MDAVAVRRVSLLQPRKSPIDAKGKTDISGALGFKVDVIGSQQQRALMRYFMPLGIIDPAQNAHNAFESEVDKIQTDCERPNRCF